MTAATKIAFTPGPWRVRGYEPGHPDVVEWSQCGLAICSMHEWDDPAWQAANARLIAAAPEMYHELEQAADTFRDFSLVLRALGKDVMSAAADIAERHIRERLAALAVGE